MALELAKKATAKKAAHIDSQAAEQLISCSFVDDCGGGGTRDEVMRMRGVRQPGGGYSGTLPRVLAVGGFQAKALVASTMCTKEEADSMAGKFLGIDYCPVKDEIRMRINPVLRVSSGKRGKKDEYLELEENGGVSILESLDKLTKRSVTSFMASQYDPQGSLAPLTLVGKLMLRSLHGKDVKLGWDDKLPEPQAREWAKYIQGCSPWT